jgi:hypothetical protein
MNADINLMYTRTQAQVFGWTALYDVFELVPDFTLGAIATVGTVVNVGTAHVGNVVGQARYAEGGEVDAVAKLPGTLVLAVEVGPVGVRQQDGVTTVTDAASVAVAAVEVAGVAGAALVSDGEAVRADSPRSAQAPDLVVTGVSVFLVFQGEAAVQPKT